MAPRKPKNDDTPKNVFRDSDGQETSDWSVILSDYRDVANATLKEMKQDRELKLTDDEMKAVLLSVKGDDETVGDERLQALLQADPKTIDTGAPETALVPIDATPQFKMAVEMASKMNNPSFIEHCGGIAKAGDTLFIAPLVLLEDWYQMFNGTNPTDVTDWKTLDAASRAIASWPPPNTKVGDKVPQGLLTDQFNVQVWDDKNKKYRQGKAWYYYTLMEQSPWGKAKLAEIDANEASGRTEVDKSGIRTRLTGHLTALANKHRLAKRIHDMRVAIHDATHGNVQVDFLRTVDADKGRYTKSLENTKKPIHVYQKGSTVGTKGMGEPFSINEFLKLRPDLIGDKWTFMALKATIPVRKRKAKAGTGQTAASPQSIGRPTVDVAEMQLAMFNAALTDKESKAFKDGFDKRLREDADLRMTACDIFIELSSYFDADVGTLRPQVMADYAARDAQRAKELKEKAEADKAKTGQKAA